MTYKSYKNLLNNKINENEFSLKLHKECMQREKKEVERLEAEHTALKGLLQAIGDDEKVAVDMSPRQFREFIETWMRAHLEDERLCPGYVERIFSAAIDIYKQKDARKAYTAEVMIGDEDKTDKADPLWQKGQEEAHRQEHEPGGAGSPAGM